MCKKFFLGTSLVFALVLSVTIFFSCNKEGENLAKSNATSEQLQTMSATIPSATIGYINDNNQFIAITEQQLETFFQKIDFLTSNGDLEQYAVIQGSDSDTGKELFAVLAKATDGSSFVKMSFQLEKVGTNQYALFAGGCSCKSTGCSTWGCNVSEFGPCSCSDCGDSGGSCEKTSTRLSRASISALF